MHVTSHFCLKSFFYVFNHLICSWSVNMLCIYWSYIVVVVVAAVAAVEIVVIVVLIII